jgi:hypothetical protein
MGEKSKENNNYLSIIILLVAVFFIQKGFDFVKNFKIEKLELDYLNLCLIVLGIGIIVYLLSIAGSLLNQKITGTYKRIHLISLINYISSNINLKAYETYLYPILSVTLFYIIFVSVVFKYNNLKLLLILVLLSIPVSLVCRYLGYLRKLGLKEHDLRVFTRNDELKIKSYDDNCIRVHTKKIIYDKEREPLSYVLNTNIKDIKRDKAKHTYRLIHSLETSNNYINLEKGSEARLTQILIDMKAKPKLLESHQVNDNLVYKYITKINVKTLKRHLESIAHKWGVNISNVDLQNEEGVNTFILKQNRNKHYYLDNIITNIRTKHLDLPFVAGYKDSKVQVLDLVDTKHLLVAGKTGSGKSVTLQSIIESLMYLNSNIFFTMIDCGRSAFNRYKKFTNCDHVDTRDLKNIEYAINRLRDELVRRQDMFDSKDVEKIQEYNKKAKKIPYLIICIDEANKFKNVHDVKNNDDLANTVYHLMSEGRKYGIYVIMAVQQTNDTLFFKSWKSQMSRSIHKLQDEIDIKNSSNSKELQLKVPSLKTGEYMLDVDGDYQQIKSCFTSHNGEYNKTYLALKQTYKQEIKEDKTSDNKVVNLNKDVVNQSKKEENTQNSQRQVTRSH